MPKFTPASFVCETCRKVVTRSDKPKMILGAFKRLRFCSLDCFFADVCKKHEQRFWAKVQRSSGCWLWAGGTDSKGYGLHHKNGRHIKAHRYSYELHKGPCGDLHVLHSCDNPPCVNPDHLSLGTHAENMADRDAKGRKRNLKGEAHGSAKLTAAQVAEIRASSESGIKAGRRFGVCPSTIYAIRKGVIWRESE